MVSLGMLFGSRRAVSDSIELAPELKTPRDFPATEIGRIEAIHAKMVTVILVGAPTAVGKSGALLQAMRKDAGQWKSLFS